MSRIVRNKLMDLVREYDSDKRKVSSQAVSLDQPIGDDDQTTLFDKLKANMESDNAHDPSLNSGAFIDLAKAISVLNSKQKEICRLLGSEGLTVLEASEYLKTPRSTIYDELKRIREIFEKKGLDDYL
jgi:RNA polymerase sigma-70 factor (ECF subfamily)